MKNTKQDISKSTPPDCVPVRPRHPGGFRAGNKLDSCFTVHSPEGAQ